VSSTLHDVIVIGGGPAGATAATLLAKEGMSVRVLEKEHFPRFHVGESLLPYNRGIFEEIGVWDEIQKEGFMVKRAAQFFMGNGEPHARLEFAKGKFTENTSAFQVERARFDEILLRHAQGQGAEVTEGARVMSHEISDERVTVLYQDDSGAKKEIHAKFLLDATGMVSLTGAQEGIRHVREGHRKVAVFGHFKGVKMPEGEEAGDIHLVVRKDSWFWMIPLSSEKVSVGLVISREEFASLGKKPDAVFESLVQSTPELQRRMISAHPLGDLHVITDYSFQLDRMVSPRLIRVGDAAGFMDPVFSSGVMLAMQTGLEGARCAMAAIHANETLTVEMRAYEARTRKAMGRFWQFIENYYTLNFIDLFLQPNPMLKLTSAINAVLAGRPELPWKVRWRLKVFFALVWLQKWVPLVPRIRWNAEPAESESNGQRAPVT
jgi:flavin-dependent dehydrogenase